MRLLIAAIRKEKRSRRSGPPIRERGEGLALAVAINIIAIAIQAPSFEGRWGPFPKGQTRGPAASRHRGRSRTRPGRLLHVKDHDGKLVVYSPPSAPLRRVKPLLA
jgi:hypothetical protein